MKKEEAVKEPLTEVKIPDGYWDDEFDDESQGDDDDWEERKAEELFERACNCTCGAWQNHNGETFRVADCCCGAE